MRISIQALMQYINININLFQFDKCSLLGTYCHLLPYCHMFIKTVFRLKLSLYHDHLCFVIFNQSN